MSDHRRHHSPSDAARDLHLLVARTGLAVDMRACEQDQTNGALLGVESTRTISMTFVIGARRRRRGHDVPIVLRAWWIFFMASSPGSRRSPRGARRHRLAAGAMLGGLLIG